jgi:hypothetical protein
MVRVEGGFRVLPPNQVNTKDNLILKHFIT